MVSGKLIALPTHSPHCAVHASPDSKPPNEEAAIADFLNHWLVPYIN